MDSVCAGLDYVFAYLNDILIASKSNAEHKKHLQSLFDLFAEHGLVFKTERYIFGVEEIDFLGHRVSNASIQPLPSKVKAITEFPAPTSIALLERFIGMINFYHIFVPHAAELMKPLYRALKGSPRPKTLDWTQELNKAFEEAKNALSQATLLHNPVPGAPIALTTDASDIAIGAVLEQQILGQWQPLAFYSRQ